MEQEKDMNDFGTKQTGMSVPQGYFADFSSRMNLLIDEESAAEELAPKVTFWQKVKPWMYLAAMFVSFVVVFRVLIGPVSDFERMTALQQKEEQALVEDALYASLSDYDVYEYLYAESE